MLHSHASDPCYGEEAAHWKTGKTNSDRLAARIANLPHSFPLLCNSIACAICPKRTDNIQYDSARVYRGRGLVGVEYGDVSVGLYYSKRDCL